MAAMESNTQRVDDILTQFDEGTMLQAAAALRALRESGATEAEAAKLQEFETTIKMLEFIEEQIQNARNLLDNTDGWTEQISDDFFQMYSKGVDANNVTVKLSFTVQCPMIRFFAIINEVDLLPEVFGGNASFEELKSVSQTQKLVKSFTPMPWPVSPRECYLSVYAVDCFDDMGCVLVAGHSNEHYPSYPDLYDVPPEPKDAVRVQVPYSFGRISPVLSEDGTEIVATRLEIVRNQNMNSVVPNWLILWLIRTFARKLCYSFAQRAEALEGTEHDERMATKPLYAHFDRRIKAAVFGNSQQADE